MSNEHRASLLDRPLLIAHSSLLGALILF